MVLAEHHQGTAVPTIIKLARHLVSEAEQEPSRAVSWVGNPVVPRVAHQAFIARSTQPSASRIAGDISTVSAMSFTAAQFLWKSNRGIGGIQRMPELSGIPVVRQDFLGLSALLGARGDYRGFFNEINILRSSVS